jgi:hypothetical protein
MPEPLLEGGNSRVMDHWFNYDQHVQTTVQEKNLTQCFFVHYKSYMGYLKTNATAITV